MRRLAPFAAALLFALPAAAGDAEEAQGHFQHAKELYQQGKYEEALGELRAARKLDPNAKDLVINLGIVSEKLGRVDDALKYFRTYAEMDLDPAERVRAEGTIKRLEGVKRAQPREEGAPPPPPATRAPPSRGVFDGWTVTTGLLAVGGLATGAVLGGVALSSRPPPNFVTGRDGSYTDLTAKAESAHTLAIGSDVALVAGAVFTALTALVYFARTKDPVRTGAGPSVTVVLAPSGVGGRF